MKTRHLLPGAAALLALSVAPFAFAADHLDSPTLTDPSVDITDVYTWIDGNNVVLIMNVNPLTAAGMTPKFSNTAKYTFHTASKMKYTDTTETETDVTCTFNTAQDAQCWLISGGTTKDYVTGLAAAVNTTGGVKSADSKMQLFAGPRDDPFFFNLAGFKDTVAYVEANIGALTFDNAHCATNTAGAISAAMLARLGGTANGTAAAVDTFAGTNVSSIVLSVDKSLLTTGGPLVAVWGSTNQ